MEGASGSGYTGALNVSGGPRPEINPSDCGQHGPGRHQVVQAAISIMPIRPGETSGVREERVEGTKPKVLPELDHQVGTGAGSFPSKGTNTVSLCKIIS